jgi:hypothetical protein
MLGVVAGPHSVGAEPDVSKARACIHALMQACQEEVYARHRQGPCKAIAYKAMLSLHSYSANLHKACHVTCLVHACVFRCLNADCLLSACWGPTSAKLPQCPLLCVRGAVCARCCVFEVLCCEARAQRRQMCRHVLTVVDCMLGIIPSPIKVVLPRLLWSHGYDVCNRQRSHDMLRSCAVSQQLHMQTRCPGRPLFRPGVPVNLDFPCQICQEK